jgi:Protein of unknown function (DUF3352)
MKKAAVIGAVVLLVAGGVAFAAMQILDRPSEDAAIELVPADAYLYANLFIGPSTDQKQALDDLLNNFPKIESTDQAIDRLTGLLDEELQQVGLSYEEDVEPWLGDQVSFFMHGTEIDPPSLAALLETTDPDAAAAAIDKAREHEGGPDPEEASYEGVDYEVEQGDDGVAIGFVDDFLVVGAEDSFKSVVDGSKDSVFEGLVDNEEYQEAFDGLDDQNLFSLYVDQGRLFEILEEGGGLEGEDAAILEAFPGIQDAGSSALALSARSEGVALEMSSTVPDDEDVSGLTSAFLGTELLESLPGDSWAALGVPDLGTLAQDAIGLTTSTPEGRAAFDESMASFRQETGLDLEDDVLSWMGDAALFVQGTNFQEIGGGLIVESDDAEATQNALTKVRDRLEADGAPTKDAERGGLEGFSIQAGAPAPIYALAGDRFVVTYGDKATDDLLDPDETLGDDETFQAAADALGDGYSPSLYVDFDGLQTIIEFTQSFSGTVDDSYQQDVKPWLDPISFVVAGARQDGDRLFQTLFVGVETEDA